MPLFEKLNPNRRWASRFQATVVVCLMAVTGARAASPELSNAWDQAGAFLFNDAAESFRNAPKSANPRERDFGEALVLLNFQPQTAENTANALATFERLTKENPNDTIGVLSRYFQARIYQLHVRPADEKKALALYDELIKARPGNAVAETAAATTILLKIYGDTAKEADELTTLAELEGMAQYLSTPAGLRGYHLNMGYAYLDFGGRENKETLTKALAHLQAAEANGMTRWQEEANLFLSIAEVAKMVGNNALAVEYYGKFVKKYKRDSRNYYARKEVEKLSAMAAPPMPAPATPAPATP